MRPRLAGLPAAYRKRIAPALALALAVVVVAIAASLWSVVRLGGVTHPVREEASQPACSCPTPNPPPGYSPCDPIPTNTGFQTGDKG